MNPLSEHERCSQHLRDFASGVLGGTEREWVEEHLASCAECTAEHSAVVALAALQEGSLTELERARLQRGVREGMEESSSRTVIARHRPDWRQRIAPGIGAVALLALLLYAAAQVDLGGGADNLSVAPRSGGAERSGGRDQENQPATSAPLGEASKAAKDKTTDRFTNGGDVTQSASLDGPKPVYDGSIGRTNAAELERRASLGEPFSSYRSDYTGRDAVRRQGRFLDLLAAHAHEPSAANDIRACGTSVLEHREYDYLPAYGGFARIHGKPALLLGFAYASNEGDPLKRFQLWAWQRPGCDHVILYSSGPIQP